jgi:hypothetical protein
MKWICKKRYPVLHLVEDLREEDHIGCIMHIRLNMDALSLTFLSSTSSGEPLIVVTVAKREREVVKSRAVARAI